MIAFPSLSLMSPRACEVSEEKHMSLIAEAPWWWNKRGIADKNHHRWWWRCRWNNEWMNVNILYELRVNSEAHFILRFENYRLGEMAFPSLSCLLGEVSEEKHMSLIAKRRDDGIKGELCKKLPQMIIMMPMKQRMDECKHFIWVTCEFRSSFHFEIWKLAGIDWERCPFHACKMNEEKHVSLIAKRRDDGI